MTDVMEKRVSRRALGRVVALAALASGCDEGESRGLDVASLEELDGGAPISFVLPDGDACIVVRLARPAMHGVGPEERIVAYSVRCPHMGCPIAPDAADPNTGHFGPCVCHQSVFDLGNDGRMVVGRACANLARVELEVRGDRVIALGRARPSFGTLLGESDVRTTVADAEEAEA